MAAAKHDLDCDGYVTITKGKETAKVMPESVPVWESLDWKVDNSKSAKTPATETPKTT